MSDEGGIELFLYKSALTQSAAAKAHEVTREPVARHIEDDEDIASYVAQFSLESRRAATEMAPWYALFYMLENDIRGLIRDTLSEKSRSDWWEKCVPDPVRREVRDNQDRERDFAFNQRSDDPLDYTTFGQLGDIIRANWDVFGGILSSQKAMGRVLSTLNTLRGPIAHCGYLAADEVDRLKLTVKDWFRVLAGPKS